MPQIHGLQNNPSGHFRNQPVASIWIFDDITVEWLY